MEKRFHECWKQEEEGVLTVGLTFRTHCKIKGCISSEGGNVRIMLWSREQEKLICKGRCTRNYKICPTDWQCTFLRCELYSTLWSSFCKDFSKCLQSVTKDFTWKDNQKSKFSPYSVLQNINLHTLVIDTGLNFTIYFLSLRIFFHSFDFAQVFLLMQDKICPPNLGRRVFLLSSPHWHLKNKVFLMGSWYQNSIHWVWFPSSSNTLPHQ